MADRAFLDTNVLVYAHDNSDSRKQSIANVLLLELAKAKMAVVSTQVLGEFFVNVTRKTEPRMTADEALEAIEAMQCLEIRGIDFPLVLKAIEAGKRYQVSYWDGLILAAAVQAECAVVYSEDLSHDQDYFGLRVVNPFQE